MHHTNRIRSLAMLLMLSFASTSLLAQLVPIEWDFVFYASHNSTDHSITKTHTGSNYNAWGRSVQSFPVDQPAHLYYKADPTGGPNRNLIVAFSEYRTSYNYLNVKYGFLILNGQIRALANTVIQYTHTRTTGNEELELRREQVGGSWLLKYFIDGVEVASVPSTNIEFFAYGLMSINNTTIIGVKTEVPESNIKRFYRLKPKLENEFVATADSELPFIYDSEYPNQSLDYQIVNDNGIQVADQSSGLLTDIAGVALTTLPIGERKYRFDLSGFSPGYYFLKLRNAKGETQYLRFKV